LKFASIESRREEIIQTLQLCRNRTLEIFSYLDSETFCKQAHPDFSPVGWHLGHIAFTEAYWLERCAGLPCGFPQYRQLFAADGLPKSQRQNLPSPETIQTFLNNVRNSVLTYLETAPLETQERLWRWLVQHESQHGETIAFILQLLHWDREDLYAQLNFSTASSSLEKSKFDEMVEIPSGSFMMGEDSLDAQDNERPSHQIHLETFWLDRYLVTCAQYRDFIAAGGYRERQFWSPDGWRWLQDNPVSHPLYWQDSSVWDAHPVCGVSWYEADAYARFVGKRLPSEAEWEKAASWNDRDLLKQRYPWGNSQPQPKNCNHDTLIGHTTPVNAYHSGQSPYGCCDMLGNVWEWTASWFEEYPGFTPYPYQGYSQTYFDGQHRVLRGGSWATRPWAMRSSFRNWYHPGVRQIFAGFRCAY
jgi:ergothioneine biosynthesis protein EgtB